MKGDNGTGMQHSTELIECVEKAVAKYSSSLRKIAFTYVCSVHDAEDIVQEVFLAYFRQAPSFENEEHEKAWLIRVTINKSHDLTKSGWFKNRLELPDDLSYIPEDESEVLEAVLSLGEKYRIPVHLYYYEGYSIEQIAKLLGIRPATIGTRLSRARTQLKKLIGGFDDEK